MQRVARVYCVKTFWIHRSFAFILKIIYLQNKILTLTIISSTTWTTIAVTIQTNSLTWKFSQICQLFTSTIYANFPFSKSIQKNIPCYSYKPGSTLRSVWIFSWMDMNWVPWIGRKKRRRCGSVCDKSLSATTNDGMKCMEA